MNYLYETHLHTCEASKCGKTPGREYIDFMMEQGYRGIIVTDHFFSGNSCVPKDLPWEERIDRYCAGYENALDEARGKDFSVFFGIEYNFDGDEYLLYGVGKDWLKAHPDLLGYSRREVYDAVHAGGGIMVQAHPYRERDYLHAIHLTPGVCDAIEVFNAGNDGYMNALARKYAEDLHLPVTAGSDIHHAITDNGFGALSFPKKLENIQDFCRAVLAGEGTPMAIREGKIIPVENLPEECEISRQPTLPVYRHTA